MNLSIAVIGCGRISHAHLQALAYYSRDCVRAVCDVNAEVARDVAEHYGCRWYGNLDEMLRVEELTAVIVCTPPATHAQVVVECLNRGLHVLCEKPVATNLEDCTLMYGTAKKAGRTLMLASKFRFVPEMVAAKALLKSGLLGRPLMFQNRFTGRLDMSKRWNSDPAVSGGGVLMDNGTHSVDIARYMIGPITRVTAHACAPVQHLDVEDSVVMMLDCNGVVGTVDLSWSLHNVTDPYLVVHGTEGTLAVGWQKAEYRLNNSQEWQAFGGGYSKNVALLRQNTHFIECITEKAAPVVNETDGIESVRVIAAAYEALHQARTVEIARTHADVTC